MGPFMDKAAMAVVGVVALCLSLGGCGGLGFGGKTPDVDPNLFPDNFKKDIIDTLSVTLPDPTNLRGAQVSDPVLKPVGREPRYASCVRYQARDADKRYTELQTRIAYFFGGRLNQLVDANAEQCAGAAYKPFPELEKLCLGASCR
jgi:hypothetical protein